MIVCGEGSCYGVDSEKISLAMVQVQPLRHLQQQDRGYTRRPWGYPDLVSGRVDVMLP